MVVDPIARWGHSGEAAGAGVDLEDTVAAAAVEVMVVAAVGGLEAIGPPRQFDDPQPPVLDESSDVPVDGGDPEIRDLCSGDLETFLRTQGSARSFEGPPDGGLLSGLALHQRLSGRRHSTTAR